MNTKRNLLASTSLGRIVRGISMLALLCSSSAALAQATIDGGPVTVPGSQSSPWIVGGSLTVGDLGNGRLEITNGGVVSSTRGYIGRQFGSTGRVTVSGTGSQWINSGTMTLGSSSNGTLEISDGGVVVTGSIVFNGVSGIINIGAVAGGAAGVLDVPSITGSNGTIVFNHTETVADNYVFGARVSGGAIAINAVSGITTLSGVNSFVSSATVRNGAELDFAQNNGFSATAYTTQTGGTTSIGSTSWLSVTNAFTQQANATLNVAIGANVTSNGSIVSAATASLAGDLNVTGFSAGMPGSASQLASAGQSIIIHTTGGITGNFSSVNLDGAASPADYITLSGGLINSNRDYAVSLALRWFAGPVNSHGNFTLVNAGDTFNVDVNLTNQTVAGNAHSWNGTSLTKMGNGTLILSGSGGVGNGYTGATEIAAGTLRMGVVDAIVNSSAVNLTGASAKLELVTFNQTISNLSGVAGSTIDLGSATLTVNNSSTSTFNGNIVTTSGGNLVKNGAGMLILTGAGSSVGAVTVSAGMLFFNQNGVFNAASFTNNARIDIGANAQLAASGTFTQSASSVLRVALGGNSPAISAATATLGGTLDVSNFTLGATPGSAGGLASLQHVIISTTGGISGDFSAVTGLGSPTGFDYLTLGGFITNNGFDYAVGLGLTWFAGGTASHGTFTLAAGDVFDVDVILGNQTAHGGWDGQSLTKDGAGTLILSGSGGVGNSYTGATTILDGVLQVGVANAIAASTSVTVNAGATLDLAGLNQIANDLSGAGTINLGSGLLTANNSVGNNTLFSGTITGFGSLDKTGGDTLTLSGSNSYSGGTTVSGGTLVATVGGALGTGFVVNNATLELDIAGSETFANALSGNGLLNKTGAGTATLTNAGSSVDRVNVQAGTLALTQAGVFSVGSSYWTQAWAVTDIGANAQLQVGTNFLQLGNATLNVVLGGGSPLVTAGTAWLDGTLNVSGFSAGAAPGAASGLAGLQDVIIRTTGGISGDFASVNAGSWSGPDYLTLGGFITNGGMDYAVGIGLTWLAGLVDGDGTFTLGAGDSFNVDVALGDRTGPFASGWNGQSLIKSGAGTLILSAANGYSGGTTINGGTLIATNGLALGTGVVTNNATLELATAGSSIETFANTLSGSGVLNKTGLGAAILTGLGSSLGSVDVQAGTLSFTQAGLFNVTGSYLTRTSAVTDIGANAQLQVTTAFTQDSGSTLSVTLGGGVPLVMAGTAALDGALSVVGFSAGAAPGSASALAGMQHIVISTTGGISGNFSSINLGSATSSVDYLTFDGFITNGGMDYAVGLGLSWLASGTASHGTFTLAAGDVFDVDDILGNQTGHVGWDGQSLTKDGAGTLILSGSGGVGNSYTGATTILDGVLQMGVANAIAASTSVTVNGVLDLNGYNQIANDLSGAGHINLGSGILTANNSVGNDTLFSGSITGSGSLTKTGGDTLTLSGLGSSLGSVDVQAGTLSFTQAGLFNVTGSYLTQGGAVTGIGANAQLQVTTAFTQGSGSTLNVALGGGSPLVMAGTAALDGALSVTGFSAGVTPGSANALTGTQHIIISTTGGISGDFSSVNLGGATSSVDYLTFGGFITNGGNDYAIGLGLSWLAGGTASHGKFTLAAGDVFDVDVILGNQTAHVGWDGQSLTKDGAGTLILSGSGGVGNSYTGATTILDGVLQMGVVDAIAASTSVTVNAGATLDLAGLSQTVNSLSGAGTISLGSGLLTANNNAGNNTLFTGTLTGAGALIKTGAGTLTLSSADSYGGGTTISGGTLIATHGQAFGSGGVVNNATLELDIAGSETFANVLSGGGLLNKTATGVATLTGSGSSAGVIDVQAGTLSFDQTGVFTIAGNHTTRSGATTDIDSVSQLAVGGVFTQASGSILSVAVGAGMPAVSATSAVLDGTLTVSGLSSVAPTSASALTGTQHIIISTTGGISGNFSSVNLGTASSPVDYLTLSSGVDGSGLNYQVGFGLSWLAGGTVSHGTFTLAAGDVFDVDLALGNQTAHGGWDGQSLTKDGAGTLILSGFGGIGNSYTGATTILDGVLQMGVVNAIAASTSVTVNAGATLDLAGFSQIANDLSGAGTIDLGSGLLTANNSAGNNTLFSGTITGSGSLDKTGGDTLTLTGSNSYSGGTTVSGGTLVATAGGALGTGGVLNNAVLQLDIAGSGSETFINGLSGSGLLTKTGSGTAILTGNGAMGAVTVSAGTLSFGQSGTFTTSSFTNNATTSIGGDAQLAVTGAFTQGSGSELNVTIGSVSPIVNVTGAGSSATLGGDLVISGFNPNAAGLTSASSLLANMFTIIHSDNGFGGSFSSVSFGSAVSAIDYLTLAGGIDGSGQNYQVGFGLTWLAGGTASRGTFTLAAGDVFDVDVILGDQTAHGGWDGQSLTKDGAGTLILSGFGGVGNSYTGATTILDGVLQTNVANAFANSSSVTVNAGATLDLAGFNQIANDLSGAGTIDLGSGILTANNSAGNNTLFSGSITGSGSLTKTGGDTLTLTGSNSYSGGTTVSGGTLVATAGGALGTDWVLNNAVLQLDIAGSGSGSETFTNGLSGNGLLTKTGSGTAILTGNGTMGAVMVSAGTLSFDQSGTFTTGSFTNNATTSIGGDAQLAVTGAFTQGSGSELNVTIGSWEPIIDVTGAGSSATLGGDLVINGFSGNGNGLASVSAATGALFTIVHSDNGFGGSDFSSVGFGSSTSAVNYLTLAGGIDGSGQNYQVGFGLTWLAGGTVSHGSFNVASGSFEVDVILGNETAHGGWDGQSLTKTGAGTLILSGLGGVGNNYTGATTINGGTLQTNVANAIATSSSVTVNGALDLNGYNQIAHDLSGAGHIDLGSGILTADNSAGNNTLFSGSITGSGSLTKTGSDTLTLTGSSDYSGGTTVSGGTLVATATNALGLGSVTVDSGTVLELAIASGIAGFSNGLSGLGTLDKTGTGTAILTGGGALDTIMVNGGMLAFNQSGTFTANSYTTQAGATTGIGGAAQLNVNGVFTQATGATLDIDLGSNNPLVTAVSATLDGDLVISGLSGFSTMASASAVTGTVFTVVHTTGSPTNGIAGTFSSVNFGGGISMVDYLTLAGSKSPDGNDYNVEIGLSWHAPLTDSHGNFTLGGTGHVFDVDVALADQAGHGGWDGLSLVKDGSGTLVLSGDTATGTGNSYTGATTVLGGTLQAGAANAFSSASAHTVLSGGRIDLDGHDQQIDTLSNGGVVALHDGGLARAVPVPGTMLTVGNYVGTGGMLVLNTVLGDETSASDRLVIANGGTATGGSLLRIINAGGAGAKTGGEGILVIEAQGTGRTGGASFTLSSRVAAGAYEYELRRGAATPQNWYLSTGYTGGGGSGGGGGGSGGGDDRPNYRVEVPLASSVTAVAADYGFAMLGTLHERVGGAVVLPALPGYDERIVRGHDGRQHVARNTPADTGKEPAWFSGAWGRVIGDRGFQRNHDFARRGADYDYTFGGIQAGLDVFAHQQADGTLDKAGIYVGYGQSDSNVRGAYDGRAGTVQTDAYTVGAYWTHHAAQGWYTDAVVQGTWYAADAKSSAGQQLKPDGFGVIASFEGGYGFALGSGFMLEPQVQLAYQNVSFDEVFDSYGRFNMADTESLRGRVGLRLAKVWNLGDGTKPRLIDSWIRTNVWHEFMGDQSTTVMSLSGENPLTIDTSLGGTWGEIGAGVSGQVATDTSLFATGSYNRSLDNKGRETWNGRVGVNVRW